MMSPLHEKHTEVVEKQFVLGIEGLRPLTVVSFRRDNSGKDLHFPKQVFMRIYSFIDKMYTTYVTRTGQQYSIVDQEYLSK